MWLCVRNEDDDCSASTTIRPNFSFEFSRTNRHRTEVRGELYKCIRAQKIVHAIALTEGIKLICHVLLMNEYIHTDTHFTYTIYYI